MKASFYCESCGAQVLGKVNECPICGKEFESIRCPQCNFEGDLKDFSNGCINCGYLSPNHVVNKEQERPKVRSAMTGITGVKGQPMRPEKQRKHKASFYWYLSLLVMLGLLALLVVYSLTSLQ